MPTTTQVEATLQINAIGARSDFAGNTVGIDDLTAEEIRFDQKVFEEGVLEPTAAFQVVAGAGGTMDVIVGSGSAKVDYAYVSGDTVGQGNYLVRLDDVTKTITLAAPDASQDRIDEVWLVVLDDVYDSSTKALPIFAVRQGDVGGGAPGPDAAWKAALKLATVTVPGGSSDITEASIQDDRVSAKMVVPAIQATDGTFNGVDVALHAHTGAAGEGGDIDANDLLNLKAAVDAANVDADTLDGSHATAFADASHEGAGGAAHTDAGPGGSGFMSASDKSKLDGVESGATADQSAAEILALIKTVDGAGSGLDADTLDGTSSGGFATSGHNHNASYVSLSGDTMTGELSALVGRNRAVEVRSGDGTNNQQHAFIEFTSDVANGAQIRGWRYGASTTMGLRFNAWNAGVVEGFELRNDGHVLFKQGINVAGASTFTDTVDFDAGLDIPGSDSLDLFWPGVRRINDPNWGSLRLEGDNGYRLYFHSSTKYLKSNDEIIPYEDSLASLDKLFPRTYDTMEGKRGIGFFAENVREAEPLTAPEPRDTELGPDEVPSYGFDGIIAHLVNGVKYLVEENAELKQRLSGLEERVAALEA